MDRARTVAVFSARTGAVANVVTAGSGCARSRFARPLPSADRPAAAPSRAGSAAAAGGIVGPARPGRTPQSRDLRQHRQHTGGWHGEHACRASPVPSERPGGGYGHTPSRWPGSPSEPQRRDAGPGGPAAPGTPAPQPRRGIAARGTARAAHGALPSTAADRPRFWHEPCCGRGQRRGEADPPATRNHHRRGIQAVPRSDGAGAGAGLRALCSPGCEGIQGSRGLPVHPPTFADRAWQERRWPDRQAVRTPAGSR